MRAAVLIADRKMELREVRDPEPGPEEALIRPLRASVCGTDLHIYCGEFPERVELPRILGHEFMGRVEWAPAVSGFFPGDLAVVDPLVPCRTCSACQDGRMSACRLLRLLGVDKDGGFSEIRPVPIDRLHHVPEGVSPDRAVFAEIYAIAFHGMRRAAIEPGDFVVIIGSGKLGLSLLDVARGTGAASIAVIDVLPNRLEVAKSLGADIVLDATKCDPVMEIVRRTNGRGADRVIEAVGHHIPVPNCLPPMAMACEMLKPAGRVVAMGLGPESTPVYWRNLVLKEAEIVASRVSLGEYPRSLAALAKPGRLHPEMFVTDQVGLEDVPKVLARMENEPSGILKTIVKIAE